MYFLKLYSFHFYIWECVLFFECLSTYFFQGINFFQVGNIFFWLFVFFILMENVCITFLVGRAFISFLGGKSFFYLCWVCFLGGNVSFCGGTGGVSFRVWVEKVVVRG